MLGPRKSPTSRPARRDDPAGAGQADPHPELPEAAPERHRRDAELERGDRPARLHHPGQLGERRRRVVDVAEQVGERERVEGGVLEGQRLRAALDELDAVAEACALDARAAGGEHVGALVDADDACSRAGGRARSRRPRCRWRRRARGCPGRRRRARRGSAASAGPGRTRAGSRSGRRSDRAARTAPARRCRSRPRGESMLARVALPEELEAAAAAAAAFAGPGERVAGVVPAEPGAERLYLVAFAAGEEPVGWLVLDGDARAGRAAPARPRRRVDRGARRVRGGAWPRAATSTTCARSSSRCG